LARPQAAPLAELGYRWYNQSPVKGQILSLLEYVGLVSMANATTILNGKPDTLTRYFNPLHLVRSLWRNRDLIIQFTRREIEGRYRGSFLGVIWSFVNPLVQLLIYTFVFGFVFSARWPNASNPENIYEFAMTLFCGITAFNIFSECVGRSSGLVLSVPNYVKKVVFPLEILPVSVLGAALFHGGISLLILVIGNLLAVGTFSLSIVLLPFALLPLVFLALGLSWFLASLGVFIRDIGYTVTLVLQVLLFTSPIFFPLERIPEPFRSIMAWNPISSIVENFRRVTLWNMQPVWSDLMIWTLITGVIMMGGYAWFMKTKKAFADVL
jgi:lipopolysaccharide transport system permease protein